MSDQKDKQGKLERDIYGVETLRLAGKPVTVPRPAERKPKPKRRGKR